MATGPSTGNWPDIIEGFIQDAPLPLLSQRRFMKYRPLGATGIMVSEIGFGAWGIGGATAGATSYGATDDGRSRAALARAFDLGITLYDTAPAYGDGHSEALIGEAFRGRRDRVVVTTKAGQERWGLPPDFSPTALRRSAEASLRRLGGDAIDLLQLHNPPAGLFAGNPDVPEALDSLRRAGKIRAWGVSVKSPEEALVLIRSAPAAVVQVNLNMLDVRAVTLGLLTATAAHRIGVIARTPLCFGFLSGAVDENTRFAPDDHRGAWSQAQTARWADGARRLHDAAASGQARSRTALRFCLPFPEVATTIPGILSTGEAEENAAASPAGPLDPEAIGRILDLHSRESFFLPHPRA
jgi:aryl-alcohol dehydrogenase-like predicted oxidoreductase